MLHTYTWHVYEQLYGILKNNIMETIVYTIILYPVMEYTVNDP